MDLSTSSAPLKIALLLATGISVHYSLTPPHKAAPKTVVADKTLFERATMVWMMVLSDILATYLAASHSPTTSPCPHTPPSPLLTPSPTLILGSLASILGNLLRQRCFRELGPMFTFELTIQPDHKLVTSGPYTFVRHPSYTGVYLTLLGPTLVALAPGAWMRESWLAVPANGVGTVLGESSFVLFALKSTNRRMEVEDRELRGVFGEVWEEYARRVRWKLVPWVY
ncbi:hypothetical protein BC835DRAFT_1301943 [Cytidiella melzeri]|nr:hypothetical protein BC835DRAFT_1301943 [Cytidiella melzeri]